MTQTVDYNLDLPNEGLKNTGQIINGNWQKINDGRTHKGTCGVGFTAAEVGYINPATGKAELAKADALATARAIDFIDADTIIDAEGFFRCSGYIEKVGWGLTPGPVWLSDTVAGDVVQVEPTIAVPLGIAVSSTKIWIIGLTPFDKSVVPIAHASTHEDGGADEIEIANLPTGEVDITKVLKPDGAGGIAWTVGGGAVFWDVLIGPTGDYADLTDYYADAPAALDQIAMQSGVYDESSGGVTMLDGQTIFTVSRPSGADAGDWPVIIDIGTQDFTLANGTTVRGVVIRFEGVGAGDYIGTIPNPCSFIDCRFQHTGTTQSRIFNISGDDVLFDNCIFDGNGYVVMGLYVTGDRCNIKSPKFYNMVATNYSIGMHVEFYNSSGNVISDAYFEELGTGANQEAIIIESGTGTDNFYSNIIIYANTTTPKRVNGMYLTRDGSVVDGDRIEGCYHGIYTAAAVGVRITNFFIKNCSQFGIYNSTNSNGASIENGYCDTCGTSGTALTGGVFTRANDVHVSNVHVVNTPVSMAKDYYIYAGTDTMMVNCTGTGELNINGTQAQVTNCHIYDLGFGGSANNVRFDGCVFAVLGSFAPYTIFDGCYSPTGDTDPTVNEDIGDGFREGDTWNNVTGGKIFKITDISSGAAVWRQIYPASGAPAAHAASHKLGGSDLIRLDEFALPTALVNINNQQLKNVGGFQGRQRATTIASGNLVIAADDFHVFVGGEGGSADQLDNIFYSGLLEGTVILLWWNGQTILVKHDNGTTGPINLANETDYVLSEFKQCIMLVYRSSEWHELNNTGEPKLPVCIAKAVTISGGLFAWDSGRSLYLVSGEGAAADDLNGITGIESGAIITLGYAGETITIKDLASAGGTEFHLRSGDLTINGTEDAYSFQNINGELVQLG